MTETATMRGFLNELDESGDLVHVRKPASIRYEIPALLSKLEGKAVLFEKVKQVEGYRVAGGVCGSREVLARSMGVGTDQVLTRVLESIENPRPFHTVENPPCQEVIEDEVDLTKLPILTHCELDGGPYATSSIVTVKDREFGYNASYHRLMLLGKDRVAARILPRHLGEFIKRGNRQVGISLGNHPVFLFAAAVSCELGKSELAIASALKEMTFARCTTNESMVPAGAEVILEGVVTDEFVDEGPFTDITGAYDIIRKERVIKVNRITHRADPIYQAIMPGGPEHRFLMGTPREATIYREVSKACKCLDVRLTAGGSSWLHAAIKIKKEEAGDPRKALEAAFKGHQSLKHAVVVDEDIDVGDPEQVEWAIATRAQMDQDLALLPNQFGSSLDPSADQVSRKTCKAGLDATIPLGASRATFTRAKIPYSDGLNIDDYL